MASKKISSKTLLWCFFAAAGKSSTKSSLARIPNEANRFVFTVMRGKLFYPTKSLATNQLFIRPWMQNYIIAQALHWCSFWLLSLFPTNAYLNEKRHHITLEASHTRADSWRERSQISLIYAIVAGKELGWDILIKLVWKATEVTRAQRNYLTLKTEA